MCIYIYIYIYICIYVYIYIYIYIYICMLYTIILYIFEQMKKGISSKETNAE